MNFLGKIIRKITAKTASVTGIRLVTERGNGIYSFGGSLYESDIVRACVTPTAVAVGKSVPKHIYKADGETTVNPKPYMRFLLEEPNPYMSMQQLLEKLARQRELSGNAFALIARGEDGIPSAIYPINAVTAEAIYDSAGNLYLKFFLVNGKQYTFSYADVIHLRSQFCGNDIFGESPFKVLEPLLTLYGTVDLSIRQAVKNGSTIRWLLKYSNSLRPEDLKQGANDFAANFLETAGTGSGVAATDSKAEAIQIQPHDYVPNSLVVDKITQRIYGHFGTNEKIVQNRFNEDEWNAFYEGKVEPILIDIGNEMSRKLFTRRERALGNSIVLEASNLQYASMATKLNLAQMVDRGAMTPNEWRAVLNKAPLPGGDEPIRRLDTKPVELETVSTEE